VSLRRFALSLALCVFGAATAASAQESDIIRGKVTGPDSLPLENVKVTAMSLSTNQSISRNTAKDGRFTIIFPNGGGDFMITYAAIGFQPTQKEVRREQDEAILIADQSLGKNPTMLNAIRVTAQPSRSIAMTMRAMGAVSDPAIVASISVRSASARRAISPRWLHHFRA